MYFLYILYDYKKNCVFCRNAVNVGKDISTKLLLTELENIKKDKEILLMERNKLLQKKQQLVKKNKELKQLIFDKEERDEKIPVHVLRKIFGSGQMQMLMS